MKIIFINKYFYLRGGSERVFFQERNYLKDKGIDVVDFSMNDPNNFESEFSDFFVSNVDFKSFARLKDKIGNSLRFIHSREAINKLSTLLKKERPVLAHLHNIYHQLTPSIIPVLKKNNVKIVMTLHDYKLTCPSFLLLNREQICEKCRGNKFYHAAISSCQGSFSGGLMLAAEAYWHKLRGSYSHVDRFLAPSQFIADYLSRHSIPKEKTVILKNGIDVKAYVPSYEDGNYALYFGRLSEEKGIVTLFKSYQMTGMKIPLKIVGTGPLEDRLKNQFESVEFKGYKAGQELISIISKSSFVVVPSECNENCSMVVLESMALGKPVIGSKIGGIPEQIDDGVTGFLFEMGNVSELAEKISRLSNIPALRKKMGMAARKKLEREYSLEYHMQKLMKIYRELIHPETSEPPTF